MQTDEWRNGPIEERLEYALVKVSCVGPAGVGTRGPGPLQLSGVATAVQLAAAGRGDLLDQPLPLPHPTSGTLGHVQRHFGCHFWGWEVY